MRDKQGVALDSKMQKKKTEIEKGGKGVENPDIYVCMRINKQWY